MSILRSIPVGMAILLLSISSPVQAQWILPDLEESEATIATWGTHSLFSIPNSFGNAFAEAYVKGGVEGVAVTEDVTITLTVRDGSGRPMANFAAEDMWLQWQDENNLYVCSVGTVADGNTNDQGVVTWYRALPVGGSTESTVQVFLSGSPLTSSAGFQLHINSADINHDGIVDLADVGLFAADYADPAVPYRSDFVNDGVMNLADVEKMAYGLGADCP